MFSNKNLFSDTPCPRRDTCKAINCIFSHHAPSEAPKKILVEARSPEPLNESNRKRRRIEKSTSSDSKVPEKLQPGTVDNAHALVPARIEPTLTTQSPVRFSGLESIHKGVSPPPIRRETKETQKTASTSSTSNILTPKRKTEVTLKKEALNPRLLKPAPATHDMRYKLLKALHDQYVRLNTEASKQITDKEKHLIMSEQELITMALDFEEQTALNKPIVYPNTLKNQILTYKKMTLDVWLGERRKSWESSHPPLPDSNNETPVKKPHMPVSLESGLSLEDELKLLPKLYTPVDMIPKSDFILQVPTESEVDQARAGVEAAKGYEVCERCKTRFQVFPGRRDEDGALCSGGKCTHHWGKPYYQGGREPGSERQRKYRCCGEIVGDSAGCVQADTHVFKVNDAKRLAMVLNFQTTPENENIKDTKPVCIDGEMGFTVNGLELIRLTATAWPAGEELFDVLVRPFGAILDLSTRFSGVTPQQMATALPWTWEDRVSSLPSEDKGQRELKIVSSPAVARDLLFSFISPQTPLIGHGLENDLNAVRIIHPTIIDTSLLFPHRAGLPYRHALKSLVNIHLGRDIQIVGDTGPEGHDSKEDANAAGDLVRFALKKKWEDMKYQGWTLVEGEFTPPRGQGSMSLGPIGVKREFNQVSPTAQR